MRKPVWMLRAGLMLACLALALTWGSGLPAGAARDGAGAADLSAPRIPLLGANCKPEGPVRVQLHTELHANSVELRFGLEPLLDFRELAWHWELSPELQLVEGALSAQAAPTAGTHSSGSVRLGFRGADAAARAVATLVVSGHFTGQDTAGTTSDERIEVRRRVRWSESTVDAPLRTSSEDRGGVQVPFVAVPAVDPAGR